MGNAQCCESTADTPIETVEPQALLSVAAVGTGEVPGNAEGQSPKAMESADVETLSIPAPLKTKGMGDASPQSARSGQELLVSPKRKTHIQAYARDFVRDLVKGREVQLLTHKADSLEPTKAAARCSIDSKVQFLTLSREDGEDVKATVANIKKVYEPEEDGKATFPEKVLEIMAPEEQANLLLIKYNVGEGKEGSIIFLEDSVESRKRFAECMNYVVKSMQKGS